jgi:hypothetical protein
MDLRRCLKRKLLSLCSLERTIAGQRSRLLQLKEGDGSTRLYHQQASHRQRKNILRTLRHNGNMFTRQEEVASAVDDYFSEAFDSCVVWRHALNLEALGSPRLELSHLEDPFTMEEVEKVIKAMPTDKAPGPDRFTGRFYAVCWHIIREDFMRAMGCFYNGDVRGMAAINKSLIISEPTCS